MNIFPYILKDFNHIVWNIETFSMWLKPCLEEMSAAHISEKKIR